MTLVLALAAGCGDDDPPAVTPAPQATPSATPDAPKAPAAPAPKPVGRLTRLRGQVTLERNGQKDIATEGELFPDDSVETGPDSSAVVALPGGRTAELGGDAVLKLRKDNTGIILEVPRGFVLSRVPADEPSADGTPAAPREEVAISILTPFGLTRVGSGGTTGSEVKVDVTEDAAKVDVMLGAVEFVSRNGEATKAKAGDALEVTAGKVTLASKKPEIVLEPIQVNLVIGGGKADVKKQGARKWSAAGKAGASLSEGDQVRARSGRPVISLAGSETTLSLAKGAELTFLKSERNGDVEESRFDVRTGGLTLDLSAKKKSRILLGELSLESEGGGQFDVSRERDGSYEVSALTGDITLQQGEKSQKLQAGQVARMGKDGVSEVASSADRTEISLPSKVGLKLYHPGLSDVALSWEGESGDYRVQVASDAGFSRLLVNGVVHQPQVVVPLPRNGSLFWRASTVDGKEVDRGSLRAQPEPSTKQLERARNEVPEGLEKTTIFYQDEANPPAVTLSWNPEPKAAQYRVAVYRADALTRPVAERKAAQTKAPLEAGILSEGNYVWSVTPLSSAGEELRGGRMNKLELVYDNSVPNLVLTSPRNGEAVDGKVRASGVAPVGSRLAINGKQVSLDGKGRFDLQVAASGRPPIVIFRLSRPSSADEYTVRMLKRGQ
jgi:hypothetical protein